MSEEIETMNMTSEQATLHVAADQARDYLQAILDGRGSRADLKMAKLVIERALQETA